MTVNTATAKTLAAKPQTGSQGKATSQDGVCDAPEAIKAMASSMPCRGRLDVVDRSVVVTARMGPAMALQRIGLNAYRGVAACLEANGTNDPKVKVVLRHDNPAYSITLEAGLPVDDAVATWRGWADTLSVPMLLQTETGEDSTVRAMLGGLVVRDTQPRKANGLSGRRPRFAKRRNLR